MNDSTVMDFGDIAEKSLCLHRIPLAFFIMSLYIWVCLKMICRCQTVHFYVKVFIRFFTILWNASFACGTHTASDFHCLGTSVCFPLECTNMWLYLTPMCFEEVITTIILCERMKVTNLQSTEERKMSYGEYQDSISSKRSNREKWEG